MPQQANQTNLPPLPQGYTLDSAPPLPEGYSMDQHLSPGLRDASGAQQQFDELSKLPSMQWLSEHYGHYGDTSPTQALERYRNRNFLEKTMDFAQKIGVDPFVKHTEAAIEAGKQGQYARAGNEGFKAAAPIGLAFLPQLSAVRPIATAVGLGTGAIGSAATQGIAKAAGATPDQQELAGNIAGLATGAAGYGLTPRSSAASKEAAALLAREVTGRLPFLGRVDSLKKPSLNEYKSFLGNIFKVKPGETDIAGPAEAPAPKPKAPVEERGIKPPQKRTFERQSDADIKQFFNYRFDQLRAELKGAQAAGDAEAVADVQRRMGELDQIQRQPNALRDVLEGKPPKVTPISQEMVATPPTPEQQALLESLRPQPAEPVSPEQFYGKYSGRSRAAKNKKQLAAFSKKTAPPEYAPQSFFNPDAPIWLRMAREAANK